MQIPGAARSGRNEFMHRSEQFGFSWVQWCNNNNNNNNNNNTWDNVYGAVIMTQVIVTLWLHHWLSVRFVLEWIHHIGLIVIWCYLNSSDEVLPISARQRFNENVSASIGPMCQVRHRHFWHNSKDCVVPVTRCTMHLFAYLHAYA